MLNSLAKIRFLPITIFAAALMLTVKIGAIWDGVDGLFAGAVTVAGARAQQTGGATPAAPPPAPVDEEEERPLAARMATADPTLLTQSEIELLQQLAVRREELERREQEMDLRTGMLKAAEDRIDRKIAELKALQVTIEGLISTYEDQQNAKMQSLVKIYENMKPKDAARIFEELDLDTLLLVAERMKERKLAPIMATMNPEKAKEMTVELSRLRQLPTAGGGG